MEGGKGLRKFEGKGGFDMENESRGERGRIWNYLRRGWEIGVGLGGEVWAYGAGRRGE